MATQQGALLPTEAADLAPVATLQVHLESGKVPGRSRVHVLAYCLAL